MKGFTKSETELLLTEVLNAAKIGKSLSAVFQDVALKTNRAKGSVRNYYYSLIKNDEKKTEMEKFVEGASGLSANRAQSFSKEDEDYLINAINAGKKSGKSVRRTIMELSQGNDKLALRYQNKYRNYLKKESRVKLDKLPVRAEDFRYFTKLSREIDGLVEKIKDKYANECVKLKKENEELSRELKALKRQFFGTNVAPYFLDKKHTN